MNINAYLKHLVVSRKIKLQDISNKTSLDTGYISRVLNNKIDIMHDKNLARFCYALEINQKDLFQFDEYFHHLCEAYLHAVYFIDREKRMNLFHEIEDFENKLKNTPQHLEWLLMCFIHSVVNKKHDVALGEHLLKVHKSFSNYYKKLFLTFYFGSKNVREEYGADQYFYEAEAIQVDDLHLEMMLYFYKFGGFAQQVSSFDGVSYNKCKEILEKTNNYKRLINLNILYSILLRNFGFIQEGLENDLRMLELVQKLNLSYSIEILLNNISNSYLLLREYEKALDYYLQTLHYLKYDSVYFSIALCLYRLDRRKECRHYLDLGKNATNRTEYYFLLIRWLDAMTKKTYSKKCYEILIQLYTYHFDQLVPQQKTFILIELVNYYKYHHMYKEAMDLSTDLINQNTISQTHIFSFEENENA